MITDWRGYINRDGFLFTNVTHPANIYDAIHIRNVKDNKIQYGCFPKSYHSLEAHIEFVKKYQIKKASILASNIDFLRHMPSLQHLFLTIYQREGEINYDSLYTLPQIKSLVINDLDWGQIDMSPDYAKLKCLEYINVSQKGHINFEKIETLKSLGIGSWKKKNLNGLFVSEQLDTLRMIQCGMHSLDGIERSKKMQCLYLHYNRSLRDINALAKVKKTLRALRIENCPKIEDFSVLAELENLELLELTGKNTLPDLQFLKKMKNLKTFVFDMNVLDGDLTPCLDLSYVYSRKNRKHYNVKDKEMPRGEYVRGNEDIELWRRME